MARFRKSTILPVILIIVVIVIAIVTLVSLTRAIFFSGSTKTASTESIIADKSRDALLNTTLSHSVRATVRGPIVADEQFHSYQITIRPDSRNLTTYSGYLDKKIQEVALSNNVPGYEEFVYALDKSKLSEGKALTGDKNDLRGVCATGRVYEFEILDNNKAVKQLWTSTCSGSKGSLTASVPLLIRLFKGQIPDSEKLISALDL